MSATTPTIEEAVDRAVDRLESAQRDGLPCAPVRDLLGSEDVTAAYAVQQRLTEHRTAAGARVVGRKIGLTSPAVQQQLGVDQPDFGVLFDDMDVSDGDEVPIGRLLQPKAEAEIAFVLGRGPGRRPASTAPRSAPRSTYAVAALEIVDSRIADWDITITDTVADNASSGLFVLGDQRRDARRLRAGRGRRCACTSTASWSPRAPAPPASATRCTPWPGWPAPPATSASRCAPARSSSPARSARWSRPRRRRGPRGDLRPRHRRRATFLARKDDA